MSTLVTTCKDGRFYYELDGHKWTSEEFLFHCTDEEVLPIGSNFVVKGMGDNILRPLLTCDPPALEEICHEFHDIPCTSRAHTIYKLLGPGQDILQAMYYLKMVVERL